MLIAMYLYNYSVTRSKVFNVKSKRIGWAGNVACMKKKGNTEFWWGNLKERQPLKDLGVDGKLKLIFKEQDGRAKNGFIWPCIILHFYDEELLAPRLTLRLVDHPLSAVRDGLLHTFEATLHVWRPSFPSACMVLVGNYEGKKSRGRPKRRWEDNIKLNLN
jgi:hypothetical protein